VNAEKPQGALIAGTPACPAPDVLLSFHRGKLSPRQSREVMDHLRRCPACARDSKFIAGVLKDETRLIQGIEAILPESKKKTRPGGGLSRLVSKFGAPRSIAAAAAVAGMVVSLVLIFSPGRDAPAGPGMSSIAGFSGPSAASALAAKLFSKRSDAWERPFRSGAIFDSGVDEPGYVSLGSSGVLAAFELSVKRDRNNELYGWSLAIYPEAARSNHAILRH
jgi:hypothetical protein